MTTTNIKITTTDQQALVILLKYISYQILEATFLAALEAQGRKVQGMKTSDVVALLSEQLERVIS